MQSKQLELKTQCLQEITELASSLDRRFVQALSSINELKQNELAQIELIRFNLFEGLYNDAFQLHWPVQMREQTKVKEESKDPTPSQEIDGSQSKRVLVKQEVTGDVCEKATLFNMLYEAIELSDDESTNPNSNQGQGLRKASTIKAQDIHKPPQNASENVKKVKQEDPDCEKEKLQMQGSQSDNTQQKIKVKGISRRNQKAQEKLIKIKSKCKQVIKEEQPFVEVKMKKPTAKRQKKASENDQDSCQLKISNSQRGTSKQTCQANIRLQNLLSGVKQAFKVVRISREDINMPKSELKFFISRTETRAKYPACKDTIRDITRDSRH